jgi:hypothetical protein
MFQGERVALRVSAADHQKTVRRGDGTYGVITDLDTTKRYTLMGMPCSAGDRCYCDAEILEVLRDAAPAASRASQNEDA